MSGGGKRWARRAARAADAKSGLDDWLLVSDAICRPGQTIEDAVADVLARGHKEPARVRRAAVILRTVPGWPGIRRAAMVLRGAIATPSRTT